ncbi:uncharacterized protein, PEP-CTERM system associated [Nitrosospira sp. Nsp18]|uniref:TIGR03016 family PEP-CTERM system-associated outer membrane protein n=1 Tax=Nitrosospira sp. Nsp18 TaxID=1855334 RepID=UPI00088D851A|nr:TIGR03016 family PEP-CTERM system-associated outer membrane protein [Nitrosospira sp. Nsp18]SDA29529.1 uncharacterized protein, PEP-CTERM system associated [Nitrosospira sp. Nsp18]
MRVPENKPCQRALFTVAHSAATVLLLLSTYCDAAEWRVTPRMNVIESYSDNIRLGRTSNGSGSGDFVSQVNPGLYMNGLGPRFNLNLMYMMNNLFYAQNSNLTRTRHQLNATGTAELIEDLFFVDGRAAMTQQNLSLTGPQSLDNVNVTGNRADVRTYRISPYLRHRFKDFASTELRYNYNQVTSDANALFNSQGTGYLFSLNSGSAFSTLGWGFNYSNQTVHFDRSNRNVEFERYTANLRYRVTAQFSLTATGGYEKNSFLSIRGNPSSPTWSVGFLWTPTERTSIAISGGQRFFGDTYSALARHRTRLTAWEARYDEGLTTFNQQLQAGSMFSMGGTLSQLLTAQNPNLSQDVIQQNTGALLGFGGSGAFADPNNFLTNRLFLQKRFQASVAMNGTRNTLAFRLFNMTRQAFSPESVDVGLGNDADLSLLNHTRQSGGNALWSYRISRLTTANLNFGYARFSFLGAARQDDMMLFSTGLRRQLPEIMPNLVGTLQVRHNRRNSNQGANYHENAAIASLSMSF